MNKEDEQKIDREMEKRIHEAFDYIYSKVELDGNYKPSEIARYLNTYWDQGDFYREWWESDDEGEWS